MKPTSIILILALAVASAMGGFYVSRLVVPGPHSVEKVDTTPTFKLPSLGNASTVSNDDLVGRKVLLNFWATWCKPCRKEMPALMDAYATLDPNQATIIGIAIDDPEQVKAFVDDLGIGYPIALADGLVGTRLMRDFGNPQGLMPFSVYLDADGSIADVHLGEVTQEEVLSALR